MQLKSNPQNANHYLASKALIFGLMTVLLYGMGFGITAPVTPFLVKAYTQSSGQQAFAIALLTLVYALGVFISAPALGALSDRFGRRPLLLFCMLGSAIGYVVFGLGGSLWILLAGRIIDGLTGGNISIILAYLADISDESNRVKWFGYAGAASGVGVLLGPTVGGLLSKFGMTTPIYFGAFVTIVNLIYGLIYMPETLATEKRPQQFDLKRLNPLTELIKAFKMPKLKWIFICVLLVGTGSGGLQSFFSQFAKDTFLWTPVQIGLAFSLLGVMDIGAQSLLMPTLTKRLKIRQIAMLGMVFEALGYGLMAASALTGLAGLFVAGVIGFGLGDAIYGPAVGGLASGEADPKDQGSVQGTSQALQALTRVIGPIVGGMLYAQIGHYGPMILGAGLLILALWTIKKRVTH